METTIPKEQTLDLVDPAQWYEQLLAQGAQEVQIQKTALTKTIFLKEPAEFEAGQDKAKYVRGVGEIKLQNVDAQGKTQPEEGPYSFGNFTEKDTQNTRHASFFSKYEKVGPLPEDELKGGMDVDERSGLYKKKSSATEIGIVVPETKKFTVSWQEDPVELKAGGYLVKQSNGSYYPINPSSFWAYEVTKDPVDQYVERQANPSDGFSALVERFKKIIKYQRKE